MEEPGLSLFQGSESLHLNTSAQREEEQEALEDQQRRNKELENLLTNAFDDLEYEDDGSSIVSDDGQHTPAYLSGGGDGSVSTHYKHCVRKKPGSSDQLEESRSSQQPEESKSREQLLVLYDVRVREIQRLSQEIDKWRRQVTLRDSERDCLQITLTQQATQLTAAQARTADLEAEVATLKQNIVNSEKSKALVAKELRSYQSAAADLQTRVDALQRGAESDSEVLLRDAQAKLKVVQERLGATANNLALKTVEHDRLSRKMADTTRDYETLLAGKTDAIGKLTSSLEASQKQVQQLRDAKELNAKLKEELERCIAAGRLKVDENKKLEALLDKKEATIYSLRNQESRDISQFNTYSDEISQLQNDCKRREQKEAELAALNAKLEADVVRLKLELEQKTESSEVRDKPEAKGNTSGDEVVKLQAQILQLGDKLTAAQAEVDRVKKLYVEVCSAKEQIAVELAALRADREDKQVRETDNANDQSVTKPACESTTTSSELSEECQRLRCEVERCKSQVVASERRVNELSLELEKASGERLKLMMKVHQMEDQSNVSSGALDTIDSDLEQLKLKLQQTFDAKLEQEILTFQRQLKEMEEMIKDETVKLFTDDLQASEAKRDQAVRKWEQCENKLAEVRQDMSRLENNSRGVVAILENKLVDLQKEFDDKVTKLIEAEQRFEQFQRTCVDEFTRLSDKYTKSLEKVNKKYGSCKKKAVDYKRYAVAKEEHLLRECGRVEEGYRAALSEVQRKVDLLLGMKVLSHVDISLPINEKYV